MLKTKTWILILAVILVISLACSLFFFLHRPDGCVVQILQDGTVIREIDLSAVTQPDHFEIFCPDGGSNTVTVEPGRICISHADCPDQVCVRRGWLFDSSAPIVCLPHRLVIQMVSGSGPDTVSQ